MTVEMVTLPQWNFINGLDKTPLDSVDPRWISALEAALKSRATPFQSGYHVNTGAVTRDGNIVFGSNHEMAITDTVTHGEEAVIAAAVGKYGPNDPIQVLAFAGLSGKKIEEIGIVPCGNCRDALRQYADLDNLVIINAPRDGGTAVLVHGKVFFKNEFDEVHGEEKPRLQNSDAVTQALRAEKTAYDIYLTQSSPPIYGAAIICENGMIFRGSYRGDVAYHSVFPISAAIGHFRDGSNDPSRKDVREIVVAASGSIPGVMYKDRQHALEFAEAIQSLNGRSETPLPVYLVKAGNSEQDITVFKTDTHEWLPLSFSPKHLGLEKAMADGYEKLFRGL